MLIFSFLPMELHQVRVFLMNLAFVLDACPARKETAPGFPPPKDLWYLGSKTR